MQSGDLGFAATLGFVQAQSTTARPTNALPTDAKRSPEQESLIESSVDRRASDESGRRNQQPTTDNPEQNVAKPAARERAEVRSGGDETQRPAGDQRSPASDAPDAKPGSSQASTNSGTPTTPAASSPKAEETVLPQNAVAAQRQAAVVADVRPASPAVTAAGSSSGARADSASLLDRLGTRSRADNAFKLKPAVPPRQGAAVAQQVSRGLAQLLQNQGGSVTLKLNPEQLGSVQVDLKLSSGRVEAIIQASDEVARGLLESQVSRLRGALEARGVTVDRLEVRALAEPAARDETSGGAADNSKQDAQSDARDGHRDRGAERREHSGGGVRRNQTQHGLDAALSPEPRGAWIDEPGAEATLRLDTVV